MVKSPAILATIVDGPKIMVLYYVFDDEKRKYKQKLKWFAMNLAPLNQAPEMNSKAHLTESGAYGVHELMTNGFTSVRSQMCVAHPLEQSEKNYKANVEKTKMAFLRSAQGLHAPLRLMHEKNAVNKVKRLPFLPSSNLALETLEGRDEYIDFDDYIFSDPYEGVESLAPPHMVMEKYLFSNTSK